MTGTLLRKELRSLLPVALLWWLLLCLDPISDFVTEFPDQRPLWRAVRLFDTDGDDGMIGLLVSLWLASGLLVRERDQGTLELLDSLPTSRLRVFLTKGMIGLAVLWSGPVVHVLLGLGLHALSRDSLTGGFHLALIGQVLSLHAAQLFVWLSLALLLAYLRRLSWIVMALLIFAYMFMDEHVGGVEVLNVAALTEIVFAGGGIVVPWNMLAVQLPLAAICATLSGFIFCGAGERALALGTKVVGTWWGKALAAFLTLAAIALWITVLIYLRPDEPEPEKDAHGVTYVSWTNARTETDRFTFTYPSNLSGRARSLAERSAGIEERVRGFFGADPLPRIEVDATGAGKSHLVKGRAMWKTVQLALPSLSDEELDPVFGHELAHVYIDTLSERRLKDDFNTSRFFHEGLAEYVEYRFFRTAEETETRRLAAALAHDREPLTFALLSDDERLTAERDTLMVYFVGRLFFEVLVEADGDDAPARVLRALARDDAPEDLEGYDLWREGFQAAGLDFETQIGRFERRLDQLVEERREQVDAVPRVGAAVSVEESDGHEWIVLRPRMVGETDWTLACRIRERAGDDLDDYHFVEANEAGEIWLWREEISGRRIQYQLGLRSKALGISVQERWTDAVLRR